MDDAVLLPSHHSKCRSVQCVGPMRDKIVMDLIDVDNPVAQIYQLKLKTYLESPKAVTKTVITYIIEINIDAAIM